MKLIYKFLILFTFLFTNINPSYAKDNITLNELLNTISESKGKQVVLINFYASWCTPCREEIPSFIEIRNTYKEDTLKMIAINLDETPEEMKAFNKKVNINYQTFHDTGELAQFYMVQGIPFTVIYGKDGNAVLATTGLLQKKDVVSAINYGLTK